MPTSPTTVIGSRVCASIVSLPPCSGKFLSVIEKHVALASGVKFSPVPMRGSMTLPYRVSTQCSVVSTDVHPATTSAASSANELRISSYLDLNGRGGLDGRPASAPPLALTPEWTTGRGDQSPIRSRRTRIGFGGPNQRL